MKNPLPTILIHPKEPRITLADFCGIHNLTIHVNERDPETRAWGKSLEGAKAASYRYYVDIPHLEIAESETIYVSVYGNGNTVKSALRDFARRMNDKEVRIDHRFIRVPKLVLR